MLKVLPHKTDGFTPTVERAWHCKRCYFLVFVQLFEKCGTLIERYTALIEKVSALRGCHNGEIKIIELTLEMGSDGDGDYVERVKEASQLRVLKGHEGAVDALGWLRYQGKRVPAPSHRVCRVVAAVHNYGEL
eukprot:SAG31_NODE_455_length_15433_cov_4.248728_6_plen_133_part_00